MSDEAPMRPALIELTLARFREFIREPEAVFWTFLFPLLLAGGLGIAFRSRPPERPTVAVRTVAGADAAAAQLVQSLARDSSLRLLETKPLDDSAAAKALRTGRAALIVSPRVDSGVEYRFDPARAESQMARLMTDAALQRAAGRVDPVGVRESTVSEPGSRYIDFVVPGLLGMNLMGSGIWGIGFSIVDARRKKLLKRLIATPMSRAEYLLSFLMQRLTLLVFEVSALVLFARFVFGVPMRGSWLQLALLALVGSLCFGGLGLLIASRARTVEGASGLMNLVMLPMWVFSGVFFSASNFPAAAQPFIRVLPLTAVIDALRGTMLEGATLAQLGPQLAAMAFWLVVPFVVALRLFRWR